MGFQTLERLLTPYRHRQRLSRTGSAIPLMTEIPLTGEEGPYYVTSTRGDFVQGRLTKEGVARVGLTEAPLCQEALILEKLSKVLPTHAPSVPSAMELLSQQGVEARSIVVGEERLAAMDLGLPLEEAQSRMAIQGYVVMVEDTQILLSPSGICLVGVHPSLTGFYVRSGEYLGILVWVDSIVVVDGELAGNHS